MKPSNISFMSISKSLKPMELQFKGYGKAVSHGGNIRISLWKTACLISSQDIHIKMTRTTTSLQRLYNLIILKVGK